MKNKKHVFPSVKPYAERPQTCARVMTTERGRLWMSVDFWLAVDPNKPVGDVLALVERLRSGILDKCMEVGEVVIQLHPRGPGAMDAPKSGGGWWGGGGGAMKSG